MTITVIIELACRVLEAMWLVIKLIQELKKKVKRKIARISLPTPRLGGGRDGLPLGDL